jgi:hypothetical protein
MGYLAIHNLTLPYLILPLVHRAAIPGQVLCTPNAINEQDLCSQCSQVGVPSSVAAYFVIVTVGYALMQAVGF